MAEINVTPFVDVMLVLLIVFMVTAPLLTVGVPVDLPRTDAAPLNQETEPLTISVDPQGRVFLQETETDDGGTRAAAAGDHARTAAGRAERRIFVRGDRAIAYGRVMEVMGTIAGAGFTRVALLAEAPSGPGAAAPRPTAPPARPAAGQPRG